MDFLAAICAFFFAATYIAFVAMVVYAVWKINNTNNAIMSFNEDRAKEMEAAFEVQRLIFESEAKSNRGE